MCTRMIPMRRLSRYRRSATSGAVDMGIPERGKSRSGLSREMLGKLQALTLIV